jgi:hypothetical protein
MNKFASDVNNRANEKLAGLTKLSNADLMKMIAPLLVMGGLAGFAGNAIGDSFKGIEQHIKNPTMESAKALVPPAATQILETSGNAVRKVAPFLDVFRNAAETIAKAK